MSDQSGTAEMLPTGWTAWVETADMVRGMKGKTRPFCRGRSLPRGGPWFPRSGKRPTEGDRWAVFSPVGQLPFLDREGWFIASSFVSKPAAFVPAFTRACGVLDEAFVNALHAKLEHFFWDDRRFGAERP